MSHRRPPGRVFGCSLYETHRRRSIRRPTRTKSAHVHKGVHYGSTRRPTRGGRKGHDLDELLTFLEMTDPRQLCPAAVVNGMVMAEITGDVRTVRDLQERVAASHNWIILGQPDDQWARQLRVEGHRHWEFRYHDEPIGVLELAVRAGEVEIVAFGLVPEHIGQGLGGWALTLATRAAWHVAAVVDRVWLYTSELDHDHALPNYRRRGFTVTGRRRRRRDDLANA